MSWASPRARAAGLAIVGGALLVVLGGRVVLLSFASVLFALLLAIPVDALVRRGWARGWALAVTSLLLLAVVGVVATFLGVRVAGQLAQLAEWTPNAVRDRLARLAAAEELAPIRPFLPPAEEVSARIEAVVHGLPAAVGSVVEAIGSALFVVVTALYLVAEPHVYREGLLALLPAERRAGAASVLDETGAALRGWLVGRLVAMILVGVATGVGLWLLDVPLPLSLAVVAAVLDFVPNIGPGIAAVPALLLAMTVDPRTALFTAILYVAVQQVEGFVLTPLIQRKAVRVPPGLLLPAQVFVGLAFGWLALVFATPLLATVVVLVRALWVRPLEQGSE